MTNVHALLKEDLVQPQELPKLSPSSINLYAQEPALWVLKHFYGQTSEFNIYAMRGVAVEDGVNHWVETGDLKGAASEAMASFGDKSFFWKDEELLQEIEALIEPWVGKCVEALKEIGDAPKQQVEISTEIEGFPIRGYIDYQFPKLQTDLKTTNTVPSAVTRGARKGMLPTDKKANVRQQAIYAHATGLPTSLLYVSPEDYYHHVLGEQELDIAMEDVVGYIKEIKELLELPIEEIVDRTPPEWNKMTYSFYWDEPLRRLANDLWEFHRPEDDDEGY